MTSCGSSPCIWGTWQRFALLKGSDRFIPMHMGEHTLAVGGLAAAYGSSPCIWGTLLRLREDYKNRRFIPMHMGNIERNLKEAVRDAVHPHAYGEHSTVNSTGSFVPGSSPCIWGTSPLHLRHTLYIRFIPMHMGNI
ncbi:hypothetical protein CHISP_1488 [Chitinispirillum alkaliphilum]|nr:hypothetical protein CHISP_1488 [Chitinispirillum alkaliphilum]